jgi:peptide/nickel transport system permease protein
MTIAVGTARAPRRPVAWPALGPTGWCALGVLVIVVLMVALAPLVAPHDPNPGNLLNPYAAPSASHWLGTDATGRDIASRLIYGGRTSLLGPAAVVLLSLAFGIPLALLAAWHGGAIAFVITRTLDVLFAIPECRASLPPLSTVGPARVRCHRIEEIIGGQLTGEIRLGVADRIPTEAGT